MIAAFSAEEKTAVSVPGRDFDMVTLSYVSALCILGQDGTEHKLSDPVKCNNINWMDAPCVNGGKREHTPKTR